MLPGRARDAPTTATASLKEACIACLIQHRHLIGDVGWADVESLLRVLPACTSEQLAAIEDATLAGVSGRDLSWYTWPLWRTHYRDRFGGGGGALPLPPLPGPAPDDYAHYAPKVIDGAQPAHYRALLEARDADIASRLAAASGRLRATYEAQRTAKGARGVAATTKLPPAKRPRLMMTAPVGGGGGGGGGGAKIAGKPRGTVLTALGLKSSSSAARPGSGSTAPRALAPARPRLGVGGGGGGGLAAAAAVAAAAPPLPPTLGGPGAQFALPTRRLSRYDGSTAVAQPFRPRPAAPVPGRPVGLTPPPPSAAAPLSGRLSPSPMRMMMMPPPQQHPQQRGGSAGGGGSALPSSSSSSVASSTSAAAATAAALAARERALRAAAAAVAVASAGSAAQRRPGSGGGGGGGTIRAATAPIKPPPPPSASSSAVFASAAVVKASARPGSGGGNGGAAKPSADARRAQAASLLDAPLRLV